jgi:hypothetical protein
MLLSSEKRFNELCQALLLFQEQKVSISSVSTKEIVLLNNTSNHEAIKNIIGIFSFWLGRVPMVKKKGEKISIKY